MTDARWSFWNAAKELLISFGMLAAYYHFSMWLLETGTPYMQHWPQPIQIAVAGSLYVGSVVLFVWICWWRDFGSARAKERET